MKSLQSQRRVVPWSRGCWAAWIVVGTACTAPDPAPLDPAAELTRLDGAVPGRDFVPQPATREGEPERRTAISLDDGLDEAELIAIGLTLDPALRGARARLGESEALLVGAGLLPDPTLGIRWRPGVGATPGTSFEGDLLFALLRPGLRAAREAVARASATVARADLAALEWRTASAIRHTLLELRAALARAALAREEAGLRREAKDSLARRRALGEATELELAAMELEEASSARELRDADARVEAARLALNRTLGVPPTLALPLSDASRTPEFEDAPVPDDGELDACVLDRFELAELRARHARVEAELRRAALESFPGLRLGPSATREADGGAFLGLGAELALPVFDGNRGEVAVLLAERETARADYAERLHALRAEAYRARAEVIAARAAVLAEQVDLLPALERNGALFARALSRGDTDVETWIQARRRVAEAGRGRLDSLLRHLDARIALDTALGRVPGIERHHEIPTRNEP